LKSAGSKSGAMYFCRCLRSPILSDKLAQACPVVVFVFVIFGLGFGFWTFQLWLVDSMWENGGLPDRDAHYELAMISGVVGYVSNEA